ncbi:Sugar or nucleoside kinase, ribokinase family [Rhizobium sp. RU20A]|uniref:PfkB family carbohydrate kinase n=1 Tax=Rhizobium sp. RU20A TaxID=1907412 RepID=UPI0009550BDD|nr:PfkB family carbohydrate kinase [Rhizobium sp. RU20A]SIR45331.1 Sugar or nucleoside kinase, ribokinase family [Rhizobium sp. RU20A]
MARTFDILGFGALAIDDILYVDAPLGAEKGKVIKRAMDHGGNVATALVAARRLGGRAAFIGWLPEDPEADIGGRELAREGVDVSLAPRHAEALPIRSVITVGSNGDRFIAYDDEIKHGTSDGLPDEVFHTAPVLLIDGYAIHTLPAVQQARRLGLSVVADIEWSKGAATDALLALADHLVLPIAFGRTATGCTEPADILDAFWTEGRSAVVLTDGAKGSFLCQAGDARLWHLPSYPVTAVDTTGAGDCYHGAYALALAEGKAPLDCVRFATAAAAISVTAHGGRRGLPGRQDCLALMASETAPSPLALSRG